mmetsp:Transcript_1563/g.3559  ORF Transcript_1563/g.3559 Transcript_1563/m.3559 type:complete len:241 (-) Transcript_1563:181-903(-)
MRSARAIKRVSHSLCKSVLPMDAVVSATRTSGRPSNGSDAETALAQGWHLLIRRVKVHRVIGGRQLDVVEEYVERLSRVGVPKEGILAAPSLGRLLQLFDLAKKGLRFLDLPHLLGRLAGVEPERIAQQEHGELHVIPARFKLLLDIACRCISAAVRLLPLRLSLDRLREKVGNVLGAHVALGNRASHVHELVHTLLHPPKVPALGNRDGCVFSCSCPATCECKLGGAYRNHGSGGGAES